jgi:hypothetical protein
MPTHIHAFICFNIVYTNSSKVYNFVNITLVMAFIDPLPVAIFGLTGVHLPIDPYNDNGCVTIYYEVAYGLLQPRQ